VTFAYRAPEQDAASIRRLQPWGVVCWRGRWYVVGHDLDRGAERCFRLSRIVGEVSRRGAAGDYQPPTGVDLISYVAHWSGPGERTGRARVLVVPGRADGVRRWAEKVEAGPDGDVVSLRFGEAHSFARWLVGFGADVTVLEPDEVRDAVIERLQEIAYAHPAPVAPEPSDAPPSARAARTAAAAR
jgi:proteasome accessory factor B